jgi:DNA-binding MarR family transcriptional regulator
MPNQPKQKNQQRKNKAKKPTKKEEKPTKAKKPTKKEEKPTKAKKPTKKEEKPPKPKKLTKKELEAIKKEEERTLEEELEEQLTDARVCDILAEKESDGMFQSELWKKLKLTSRDGSRLSLKLERMGTITREKLLEKGRWTYKLILKKTPISTQSIENSPCLVCPVEQKCSLEGEISPKNCQLIEDWVITETKKPSKAK